jgi:formylglycine-generating enzyme required for sulfatase activity
LKTGRAAADVALDQTRQQASAQLAEARKAQETARSSLHGAGLGGLGEGLSPGPSAAASGANPEVELARRLSGASAIPPLLAADIAALQQWREAQRRRRRVLIGVAISAVLAIMIGGYLGYRTVRTRAIYASAVASLSAGQWEKTRSELAQLASLDNTYEDATALLRESYYRPAVAALSAGQWESAKTDLEWLASNAQGYASKAVLEAGPVVVPAGEFLMGSTDADGMASTDEKPQHKVYLDAFLIDRTEVTNAMYAKCEQAGACQAPRATSSAKQPSYYGNPKYDNYPVINVTWNDAQAYCAWAGGRLPTEAEWEKAARGTDGRTYPWGDEPPDPQKANYSDSKVGDTTPVGVYPPGASPYGALDMAGNVWEWTADWYGDATYASSSAKNPTGPSSGDTRVLRGGSWGDGEDGARAANRFRRYPVNWNDDNGFRCARSP